MSRGKNLERSGRFHSYNCKDRKNCSSGKCDTKVSYALKSSIDKRKKRDYMIGIKPELSRKYFAYEF